MGERVVIKVEDHVAEVRLNRPDKYNAVDAAMFEAVAAAADEIAANREVRAVVLTAEGDNFCAGIDMSLFQSGFDFADALGTPVAPSPANIFQRPGYAWRELPVPVICAINGVCYGAGFQIAMGADIRYSAADAKLSIMEIKWGLIPDMSLTTTVRDVLPADKVKELMFTAAVISGTEAQELGVVTAVHEDPVAAARQTALEIASKSPDAIRAGKRLLNEALRMPEAEALALEARLQGKLIGSPNQVEAAMANFEKRAPRFKN
jgi:enoyl-CoA hydratase/carnithine racemase